jgi:hypothetical protein
MVTSQRPRTGERHATPLESTRRGAHRARPGAVAAALPVLAVVVVVVIAIFAMYQLLDSNGSSDDGQTVADTPQASTSSQPSGQPAQSSPPPPSTSQPVQSAAPIVDRGAVLTVKNNTSINGLGKRAATKLKGAGWKVNPVGNLIPRNQVSATTVFYSSSEQEATAQAVVDDLGIGSISQSQQLAKDGITVVLAADFDS